MSWMDQGRQYHMRFGHGTAPDKGKQKAPDPSVTGMNTEGRILALAHGAIASLPAAQRGQAEAYYDNGGMPRLREAMTAWMQGMKLDQAAFADRFFGRDAEDPVACDLHGAVLGVATATSYEDVRHAAEKVGGAMTAVGIYQWPRFIADAVDRTRDPATIAAAETSRQPMRPDIMVIRSEEDRKKASVPVPFVDRNGQAILKDGKPMMRPASMPPEFFVAQGLEDKAVEEAMISSGDASGVGELGYQASALAHFNRGASWDAQRIGGVYHDEFVDYATVAIGLYAAANGMSLRETLNIEDFIARSSHYGLKTEMDLVYTHLPVRNVKNTETGFSLFQSGQISVVAP